MLCFGRFVWNLIFVRCATKCPLRLIWVLGMGSETIGDGLIISYDFDVLGGLQQAAGLAWSRMSQHPAAEC